jgi:hypothetical protein
MQAARAAIDPTSVYTHSGRFSLWMAIRSPSSTPAAIRAWANVSTFSQ